MKPEDIFQEKDRRITAFLCRCSPEGVAEADMIVGEVCRRLGELGYPDVKPENFLTIIVITLNWEFGAEITGIFNDQWSMVAADTWRGEEEDKIHVSVQCDDAEDGIAAAWLAHALYSPVRGKAGDPDPAATSPDRESLWQGGRATSRRRRMPASSLKAVSPPRGAGIQAVLAANPAPARALARGRG